jgi:uncharacterized protein (TIGR03118 family)
MRRFCISLLVLTCLHLLQAERFFAAENNYKQKNLVSDTQGLAPITDSNLINPWGVAFLPGTPFWISGNNGGESALFDKTGARAGLFTIPSPAGSSNFSTPSGMVANAMGGFNVNGAASLFIFATEDGTISGWNGHGSAAVRAVDNSRTGAVYKGLAMISNASGNFLLAANFNSGAIDVFDSNFKAANLSGTFTDPALPAGFAPFGIHVINNFVVVTFALQDDARRHPMRAPGAGHVDLFDLNGNLVRHIAAQGALNAPWGAVMAPSTFGAFAGKLLVGNFGDGAINAFDFASGTFLGQLQDSNGTVIRNASLWDLVFDPSGKTGDPNTLYLTAGLANEHHGLFAALTPNVTPAAVGDDFSISGAPPTLSIAAGHTASFTATVTSMNNFNSAVTLTCSGQPAGTSCTFNPAAVTPPIGGMMTSTLTIATNGNPYHPPYSVGGILGMFLPVPLMGLLGLVFVGARSRDARKGWLRAAAGFGGLGLVIILAGLLTGCGYSAPNNLPPGTQRSTYTVMIIGTSGSLTHSSPVTLTVQ